MQAWARVNLSGVYGALAFHTKMPDMPRTSNHQNIEGTALAILPTSILSAWRTNNRVTMQLIASLPAALLDAPIPNIQRRTVRTIVAHLHNARCSWLKTLGSEHGIPVPDCVDRSVVTKRHLVAALKQSGAGMEKLLKLGLDRGGTIPP